MCACSTHTCVKSGIQHQQKRGDQLRHQDTLRHLPLLVVGVVPFASRGIRANNTIRLVSVIFFSKVFSLRTLSLPLFRSFPFFLPQHPFFFFRFMDAPALRKRTTKTKNDLRENRAPLRTLALAMLIFCLIHLLLIEYIDLLLSVCHPLYISRS